MSESKKNRNKNLTVPNALSVLRIAVIPPFVWFFMQDYLWQAIMLLVISGLSDMFDGMIARKFNQVTELGKMLDPLADKLTQATIAVCLAIKHPVLVPVLMVFVVKESCMIIGGCILIKKKKRPCAAKWYGKVATVLFYVSATVIVLMEGVFHIYTGTVTLIAYILLSITAGFMIYALVKYGQIFCTLLHSEDPKDNLDLQKEIKAKKNM